MGNSPQEEGSGVIGRVQPLSAVHCPQPWLHSLLKQASSFPGHLAESYSDSEQLLPLGIFTGPASIDEKTIKGREEEPECSPAEPSARSWCFQSASLGSLAVLGESTYLMTTFQDRKDTSRQ